MKFALFSHVIVTVDVPDEHLKAGNVGTIVEQHAEAGQEDGYRVEFFDKRGQTVAVATVPASALRLRPRLPLAASSSTSVPPSKATPVNTRWVDGLLQLLAGVIGAVAGGFICQQAAEINAWRLQNDFFWQHYTFWIYLLCCVGGLVVGVFATGLILMIYRSSRLIAARRRSKEMRMSPADDVQFSIHAMLESDIPDALKLWRRTPGVGLNESDTPARLVAYLAHNPGQSFVARDVPSGKLLGAVLGGNDGRRGYLQHLAVEPAARGRGIGSSLSQHCLDALAALDIYKCNVFVFTSNTAGRGFWRKQGWKSRDDLLTMQTLINDEG